MMLLVIYLLGAALTMRMCFKYAHYSPNWHDAEFMVPMIRCVVFWPLFVLGAWGRATWLFFKEGTYP